MKTLFRKHVQRIKYILVNGNSNKLYNWLTKHEEK